MGGGALPPEPPPPEPPPPEPPPHVPLVEPGETVQDSPEQQSALTVQPPAAGTQRALLQT
jgi:protein TonB